MISERKFRSLPIKLQHKKKPLRSSKKNPSVYNLVAPWIDLKPLDPTPENLSHRFHHHISKAEISLKEHNLLISKTDILSSTPIFRSPSISTISVPDTTLEASYEQRRPFGSAPSTFQKTPPTSTTKK